MAMLTEDNFRLIGADGIGNHRAKVAHAMAWFNDALYLGCTHHRGEGPQDRARILRYTPATDRWDEVLASPLVPADERATPKDILRPQNRARQVADEVPLYRGFRSMLVFQGPSDPAPALYASTICHWGARLLRSVDGEHFEEIPVPDTGDHDVLSFRSLVAFKGRLFTAPTGAITKDGYLDRNFSGDPLCYVSADPLNGGWVPAMAPGCGDPDNSSISRLAVFNDHLYASFGNVERGFQLWKTDGEGEAPYTWTRVLTDGAWRYDLNETAPTMMAFSGALYVSSGLPGLGYDDANDVGPAAAELLRVNADDSWDLIAGTPRFTPDGFKVPEAAMGPGFGDFCNSLVWSMGVHEGVLYLGWHHWGAFDEAKQGRLEGGFQVWASEDGEAWQAVTLDGFGDPFEIGVRTMLSTPIGLVMGTSNHQEIARLLRRKGLDVPLEGGMEVWLGN